MHSIAKYQKTQRGTKQSVCLNWTSIKKSLGTLKKFRKKVTAEKIERRDTFVSAGFVGYVKKVKNERRDPLETEKISKKVAQC